MLHVEQLGSYYRGWVTGIEVRRRGDTKIRIADKPNEALRCW